MRTNFCDVLDNLMQFSKRSTTAKDNPSDPPKVGSSGVLMQYTAMKNFKKFFFAFFQKHFDPKFRPINRKRKPTKK